MKIVSENLSLSKVVELMNSTAKAYSIMLNRDIIITDMMYVLNTIEHWYLSESEKTAYVVVCDKGVGIGDKTFVEYEPKIIGIALCVFELKVSEGKIVVTKIFSR